MVGLLAFGLVMAGHLTLVNCVPNFNLSRKEDVHSNCDIPVCGT